MSASEGLSTDLTAEQSRDLRRLAGIMVPASAEYGVPGADDEIIFADIVRSLGRDKSGVQSALVILREISGAEFCNLDADTAETAALKLLESGSAAVTALGRAVLQCYYRDDRVFRSLGVEPAAPFPAGRPLEQGDWSLLDAVRGRAPIWRDDRKQGT